MTYTTGALGGGWGSLLRGHRLRQEAIVTELPHPNGVNTSKRRSGTKKIFSKFAFFRGISA